MPNNSKDLYPWAQYICAFGTTFLTSSSSFVKWLYLGKEKVKGLDQI